MISEGSCGNEDWSNDAENSASPSLEKKLFFYIKHIKIENMIVNCNNISQYYCICDQMSKNVLTSFIDRQREMNRKRHYITIIQSIITIYIFIITEFHAMIGYIDETPKTFRGTHSLHYSFYCMISMGFLLTDYLFLHLDPQFWIFGYILGTGTISYMPNVVYTNCC